MDWHNRKRRPGQYLNKSKKHKEFTLESGLKGFICTCNIREKDCIRESYNILNEYADKLYSKEKRNWRAESKEAAAEEEKESDEDIETALDNELESMKKDSRKSPSGRRFQVVESGANNCLFIRTTLEEPVELVQEILKDIEKTKKQKTRFLLRMIPIEATCKAYLDDIKEHASKLFDKYFIQEERTFSIIINRRNSNMVSRDEAIGELAEMIKMRNINNRVDLKQPQLTVVLEIIRSMCCIGVLPDYFRFRKYNLLELSLPEGKKEEKEPRKDTSGDAANLLELSLPEVKKEENEPTKDSSGDVVNLLELSFPEVKKEEQEPTKDASGDAAAKELIASKENVVDEVINKIKVENGSEKDIAILADEQDQEKITSTFAVSEENVSSEVGENSSQETTTA